MRFLLLLTSVAVVFAKEGKIEKTNVEFKAEIKEQLKPAESIHLDHDRGYNRAGNAVDRYGTVAFSNVERLSEQGHPEIGRYNKLASALFTPNYNQHAWGQDYNLQTDGRDHARGPEGHGREHMLYTDYDAYLEHLRLIRLSERQLQSRGHGYGRQNEDRYRQDGVHYGQDHGYGQGRVRDGSDHYRQNVRFDQDHNHGGHDQALWHRY